MTNKVLGFTAKEWDDLQVQAARNHVSVEDLVREKTGLDTEPKKLMIEVDNEHPFGKDSCNLVLLSAGSNRVTVLKHLAHCVGSPGIKFAKAILDDGGFIRQGISLVEALKIKATLEDAGARVSAEVSPPRKRWIRVRDELDGTYSFPGGHAGMGLFFVEKEKWQRGQLYAVTRHSNPLPEEIRAWEALDPIVRYFAVTFGCRKSHRALAYANVPTVRITNGKTERVYAPEPVPAERSVLEDAEEALKNSLSPKGTQPFHTIKAFESTTLKKYFKTVKTANELFQDIKAALYDTAGVWPVEIMEVEGEKQEKVREAFMLNAVVSGN